MIDFWIGIQQLNEIFVQKTEQCSDRGLMIPRFFTPAPAPTASSSSCGRDIDGIDIYDIEKSIANVANLKDRIVPDAHRDLLSAVQLQHSLRAAVKANLMTTRVTGYVKKKKFSSLLNKSSGSAHLTTDLKLVPDVTSVEYRVCHAMLYMLQKQFEDVAEQVTALVQKTVDHIKDILCIALIELDPQLTIDSIEESGLFLWSNPTFLTDWVSFVNALHHKDDEVNDPSLVKNAKRKSVFKKIRKSVTGSLSSKSSKEQAEADALNAFIEKVASLAPVHKIYLDLTSLLSTPTSPCYFKQFTDVTTDTRPRVMTDTSDCSTDSNSSKWYFGKFVGRKNAAERRRSTSANSVGSDDTNDDSRDEEAAAEYAKIYSHVFIGEDENAAVEIDHRMIHAVVNEAPADCSTNNSTKTNSNVSEAATVIAQDNNTDVRLFSWYMYVVMHNTSCVSEKLTIISETHATLNASTEKETDRACLQQYGEVGKVLMDHVVLTTQVVRSLRDLFYEDIKDDAGYQQTIRKFCLYVTHEWLKKAQLVQAAVQGFIDMRRENVAVMVKNSLQICSPEEVEEIICHDDGMHVHKLITAVNNGRSEVVRLLESRLKGPPSPFYSDMELFSNQAHQVLDSLTSMLDEPLKQLKC